MSLLNIIVFLFSFIAFTISAYAQGRIEEKVTIVEKLIEKDSSAFHRLNKKFTVQYQTGGIGPAAPIASGFIVGYHLSADQLLQLELTGGAEKWNGLSSANRSEGKSAAFYYKQFNGNSFYFKTGLEYSVIDRVYNWAWLDNEATDGYSYKGSKVSASFSIGNQWQWENFTIGCDWIGISAPIYFESHDEKIWGNQAYGRQEIDSSKETYLENGFPLALHLYLGASF